MPDVTGNIKSTLADAFNEASTYKIVDGQSVAYGVPGMSVLGFPLQDFSQPPVDFEKRHGLTGLSKQYFLPPDLLPRELQEYAMVSKAKVSEEARERLEEVWGELKKYNPETLGKLSFDEDDPKQLYHAILGAASAFLPEDIQSWLDGKGKVELGGDPAAALVLNRVEVCLGWINWAPSLPTLRSIEAQMIGKRAFATGQRRKPAAQSRRP